MLLDVGALPLVVDNDGSTPLQLSAGKNDLAILKVVLEHDAHLDCKNNKGERAINLIGNELKYLHPMRHISPQCFCARTIVKERIFHESNCLYKIQIYTDDVVSFT